MLGGNFGMLCSQYHLHSETEHKILCVRHFRPISALHTVVRGSDTGPYSLPRHIRSGRRRRDGQKSYSHHLAATAYWTHSILYLFVSCTRVGNHHPHANPLMHASQPPNLHIRYIRLLPVLLYTRAHREREQLFGQVVLDISFRTLNATWQRISQGEGALACR